MLAVPTCGETARLPNETMVVSALTSTPRAVLVSALTTMVSFGSLAVSPHVGTASMGKLLLISIGLVLISTLVVLPALLRAPKPAAKPAE